jgi:hypothetical protein
MLAGKCLRERLLVRSRLRREDNIKMSYREIYRFRGCEVE